MPQIIAPPVDLSQLNVNTMRNGKGPPQNSFGNDGDFYIDTNGPNIYGPRANGAWPSNYVSMIGNSVSDFHSTTPQKITQAGAQTIVLPVSNPNYVSVFYNGQLIPDSLVAINGNTLTIDASLNAAVGDYLEAEYSVGATTNSSGGSNAGSGGGTVSFTPMDEIPVGSIDGTNKSFTLSLSPISNTLKIYLNGTVVDPSEYSLSGLTFTLTIPPAATSRVRASYFH